MRTWQCGKNIISWLQAVYFLVRLVSSVFLRDSHPLRERIEKKSHIGNCSSIRVASLSYD